MLPILIVNTEDYRTDGALIEEQHTITNIQQEIKGGKRNEKNNCCIIDIMRF